MTQLNGKSMNIIEQNIEKLKEIFPEVFSEGKIDFSKLEEELGAFKTDENERYNFTWNGKSEAKKIALTPSTGTLRPCKEESKDWDTTQNLYIEGDNLEVLKLLQKSYHKKVKMIYIDPPYNTGKDFVYKDNFRDNIKNYLEITGQVDSDGNKLSTNSETSGRYHSDWLNMMYPRLKLARNLLKDDGVIFISIDDNEVSNLRKLCDEIFGEDNIKTLVIKMSEASGLKMTSVIKVGSIPKLKEYVIVIKSNGVKNLYFDKVSKGQWDNEYNIFLSNFTKEDRDLINTIQSKENILEYDINNLDEIAKKIDLKSVAEILKENNVNKDEKDEWLFENAWRIVRTTASDSVHSLAKDKKEYCANDLFFVKSSTGLIYFVKANFSEDSKKPRVQLIFADDNLEVHPGDFWSHIKTTGLDNEGGVPYKNGKKPLEMLKSLIKSNVGIDENSIVLDFFSGSASTAQAVMELNMYESYNLKFIMIQIPENLDETIKEVSGDTKKAIQESINFLNSIEKPHILTELGKERIRRAGEKVKSESGKNELDIGFKVLKLDSSNIKSWDSDFENLTTSLLDAVENIKSDRNEEDLVYEILLKYGLDLTLPIEELQISGKKIFSIGFGSLVCCLDNDIDTNIVEKIAELKKQFTNDFGLESMRVVFKDSSFKDSVVKTNALQILKQNGIDEVVSV